MNDSNASNINAVNTEVFNEDAVTGIVAHMNEDHADALELYIRAFTDFGASSLEKVEMTGIDATGIDLSVWVTGRVNQCRISFSKTGVATELADRSEARATLVEMVRAARALLEEKN